MTVWWPAGVAMLAVASACSLQASFDGSRFRCERTDQCPSGLVCVSDYCQAGGRDGGQGDGSVADQALIGNLITYTFSLPDIDSNQVVFDRSGNGHDGQFLGDIAAGRYGNGALFVVDGSSPDQVEIPDHPNLFLGDPFTVEMWIKPATTGAMTVFADEIKNLQTAEAVLEITGDGRLQYATYPCNTNDRIELPSEPDLMTVSQWTHVAVTRAGDTTVTLYVDALPVASERMSAPCPVTYDLEIAKDSDSTTLFDGLIDEFKLSDYAKSPDEIAASMSYDSAGLIGVCGDRLIEADETCERDALCCATEACAIDDSREEGCSIGGTGACEDGTCVVPGGRVTEGLIGDYLFDEGSGSSAADSLGNLPPLLAGEPGPSWGSGYVALSGDPMVTGSAVTDFIDSCVVSGEVTIEAWVTPSGATVDGLIADLSSASGEHNLALRQRDGWYTGAVRSNRSSGSGKPEVPARLFGDSPTGLAHLVLTRDSDGWRRLYINGSLRASNLVAGGLNWPRESVLAVGNDALPTADDPWLGFLHRLSLYCRALSAREAAQNFTAGM